jgi:hypothetical protein
MFKNAFSLFLVIVTSMMLGSYMEKESYGVDVSITAWVITYGLLVLNGFVLVVGLVNHGKKLNNDPN